MAEKQYISKTEFLEQKRKQYCEDCERRKGMKNGKYKTLYETGGSPCKACSVGDMLDDVEDFPAADVEQVRHGRWILDDETSVPICSECHSGKPTKCVCSSVIDHKLSNYEIRYCYFCGAKMGGRSNNG